MTCQKNGTFFKNISASYPCVFFATYFFPVVSLKDSEKSTKGACQHTRNTHRRRQSETVGKKKCSWKKKAAPVFYECAVFSQPDRFLPNPLASQTPL